MVERLGHRLAPWRMISSERGRGVIPSGGTQIGGGDGLQGQKIEQLYISAQ